MESFNSQVAYQALCDNTTNILEAELDPYLLAGELVPLQIVGDDDMTYIIDNYFHKTKELIMERLLNIIKATVKGNGTVFGQFIEILEGKDSSKRKKDLAKKLRESYTGNDK